MIDVEQKCEKYTKQNVKYSKWNDVGYFYISVLEPTETPKTCRNQI